MRILYSAAMATMLLVGGTGAASAQQPIPPPETPKMSHKADVTYARVKEFTAGQKIVLDVDNAPDKSFDLTDKDMKVVAAKTLKVGDPVKVPERTVNGKKVVDIVHHTGGGVKHGAKTRAEEQKEHK